MRNALIDTELPATRFRVLLCLCINPATQSRFPHSGGLGRQRHQARPELAGRAGLAEMGSLETVSPVMGDWRGNNQAD